MKALYLVLCTLVLTILDRALTILLKVDGALLVFGTFFLEDLSQSEKLSEIKPPLTC